jgi:non-heme Fe2+,alpha-ketoglutarate-dependent halogenase
MPKKLTEAQIAHYREHGYVSPVDALPRELALSYRARMEECEQRFGPIRQEGRTSKPHLLFRWAAELVREPAVLDAIEDLIGPDIILYQLTIFPKEARTPSFVDWHQDATYFSLEPAEQVTAWVALSDASITAGCMEVIPGSHRAGQLRHEDRVAANNMLSRGQTLAERYDSSATDFMPLQPGQLSLHHTHIIHRSGPNNSDDRRIGFGISYVPARCRCTSSVRVTASLVRGEDRFHHFEPEHLPVEDCDEAAKACHTDALRRYTRMRSMIYT